MKRREFIALLSGATIWPPAARAQQPAMPVIGFLRHTSLDDSTQLVAALNKGLNEAGYFEGQSVAVEYRWAENRYDRLPALAADLIRRQVAVIVAGGNGPALAAKAATATIPIVFSIDSDPVQLGLVASMNRPGGNVTGVSFLTSLLDAKRLGLLHEVAPNAPVIAVLVNPTNPTADSVKREVREAARTLGLELHVVHASTERELNTAFATLVQQQAKAILVASDAFFLSQRDQIVALAARYSMPAIYHLREFVTVGGLMSYGTSIADTYRQVGVAVGKILKGEKPADLPVVQSIRFQFVVNLKTAKALGLTIPPGIRAIADEVIE